MEGGGLLEGTQEAGAHHLGSSRMESCLQLLCLLLVGDATAMPGLMSAAGGALPPIVWSLWSQTSLPDTGRGGERRRMDFGYL